MPYGDGQYWHDTWLLGRPPAPRKARSSRVYYQTVTRHYIEALRDGNVTNHWGDTLHGLWLQTNKAAPTLITSQQQILQPFLRGDFDDDGDVDGDDFVALEAAYTGPGGGPLDPSAAIGDFDGDDDIDCADGDLFALAWTEVGVSPVMAICAVCGDGVPEGAEQCDDGASNGTTICDCALDCTFPSTATACDDLDACTAGDLCDGVGACVPGTPLDPDDGVTCTVDSCDPITGVAQVATDSLCDDNDVCTGSETCDAVLDCQAGTPLNADDGVTCTVDSCDPITGIANVANDTNCDDGQFCNGSETCDPVLDCQSGAPPFVDDGVFCTVDSCNEATDSAVNAPSDLLCDNDRSCDGAETCDPVLDCQVGTPPQGAACAADYVILLSVDGVNSDLLKSMVDADDGLLDEVEVKDVDDSGDYHNWKRLQDEGVYTWNARTDFDATITTPNHASMITGYPVGRRSPGYAGRARRSATGGDTERPLLHEQW